MKDFPDMFRPTRALGSYRENPSVPMFSNDPDVVDPLANWAALGRELLAASTARVCFYTSDAAQDVLTAVTDALDEIDAAVRGVG